MDVLEAVTFGTFLFAALAALLQWRHRRMENQARLNRGLRDFLAGKRAEPSTESLSTVAQQG